MKRSKSVVVGLSIVAAIAAVAPAAHAGGGMGGGSLADVTAPMACRLVLNAANQPQTINIVDQFANDVVKVGAAVLYCQTGLAALVSGPTTTALPSTVTPDSITCYNLGNADQLKQPVTFTDAFGEQQATLGGISVFCVPALFGTVPPTP